MKPALFAMVSTKDSAHYTPHALKSFNKHTDRRDEDRYILIENNKPFIEDNILNTFGWELLRNESAKSFAANANQMITLALEENRDLYFLNNDVIFSPNWLPPLRDNDSPAILTPISNREVPYVSSVTSVKTANIISSFSLLPPPMQVIDYVGREIEYEYIVKTHQRNYNGFLPMMVLPFFCVKIPLITIKALGYFDETFGEGGGEDFDYCLRANLKDIPVAFALNSYLLHFGGKSTWEGEEEKLKQAQRQAKYREVFNGKWGEKLFQLILDENASIIENDGQEASVRETILKLYDKDQLPDLQIN